jgi:CheY-like chemotaxis protein
LVLADEARLVQVVSNLLTNAARYTEPGGQIRVHAARAGTEVVLSVSDTGIGIQPELLSKLFEAFVQGKRTIDRHEGGLGLGLALARSLTKLHGGTIEARSDGPGRGSEFVVRLPALEATAATTVDARPAHAAPPAACGARRVLVVDDNKDAAMMLAEVLASEGFVVRVAIDPLQALEYMESFVADIAVLDIGLPVIDGHELARRLRERYGPSLRLVALTGYGQQADKEKAREVGFDVHLVKPVDVSHLVQAILP